MAEYYVSDAPARGSFPVSTVQSTFFARAMAALGNPTDFGTLFLDYTERGATDGLPSGWVQNVSGGVVSTGLNAGTKGGVSRMGVTNSAAGNVHSQNNGSYVGGSIAGGEWIYYASRFYIDGALDAQQRASQVLHNAAGTRSFGVGFFGPSNATNWLCVYDGTFATPTATLDLGAVALSTYVEMEFWIRGGSIFARRNNGSILTATIPTAPSDSLQILHDVRNGTNATAQSMFRDWTFCVFPR